MIFSPTLLGNLIKEIYNIGKEEKKLIRKTLPTKDITIFPTRQFFRQFINNQFPSSFYPRVDTNENS